MSLFGFQKGKKETPRQETQYQPVVNVRTKRSKLLLCRCSSTKKKFCIRLDRKIEQDFWKMAYAFPFTNSTQGEAFADVQTETLCIHGSTPEYKGCPYCQNPFLSFCSCGTQFCDMPLSSSGDWRTCPTCGQKEYYTYGTEFAVKGVAL